MFKSHHADHRCIDSRHVRVRVDINQNPDLSSFGYVARLGVANRCPQRAQVLVVHTSPFAGLGHRLITWLPTRQSRFDSGSPHHYKHPSSIGKDICFSHRRGEFNSRMGARFWAGSFSGMTARSERAYGGSIPSPTTNRSASREGLLLITANRTVRNRYERPSFRPHGAAPWVGTNLRE